MAGAEREVELPWAAVTGALDAWEREPTLPPILATSTSIFDEEPEPPAESDTMPAEMAADQSAATLVDDPPMASAFEGSALPTDDDGPAFGEYPSIGGIDDAEREPSDREERPRRRDDGQGNQKRIGLALTSIGVAGLVVATVLLSLNGASTSPGASPAASVRAVVPSASPNLTAAPASVPGPSTAALSAPPTSMPSTTNPSSAQPSATSATSATVRPSPTGARPTRAPSSPNADFHFPNQVQPARFVFQNGTGGCPGMPITDEATGRFVEQGGNRLRIEMNGATDQGTFGPGGDFDAGGADPLAHWQGHLTGTGGTATYQLADDTGCVETYDALITFT